MVRKKFVLLFLSAAANTLSILLSIKQKKVSVSLHCHQHLGKIDRLDTTSN
jgi:hypothetical protein